MEQQDKIVQIFEKNGFIIGRMISGSKSQYRSLHPDNFICFNANIFTEEYGKVWYGDIDLTKDEDVLRKIANEAGVVIYLLRELSGRFGKEDDPINVWKPKAIWSSAG